MERATLYLLLCSTYQNERVTLFSKISMKGIDISDKGIFLITQLLLYSDLSLDDVTNTFIITSTIGYILTTKRFENYYCHYVTFVLFSYYYVSSAIF